MTSKGYLVHTFNSTYIYKSYKQRQTLACPKGELMLKIPSSGKLSNCNSFINHLKDAKMTSDNNMQNTRGL